MRRLLAFGPACWTRWRKPIIGIAVVVHFTLGLLCFAKAPSALLAVPALEAATDFYSRLGFPQTWRMFAPPSQSHYEIGYSLEFEGGWTPLLSLDDFLVEQSRGRRVLPRGYIRIANSLRHPVFRKERLEEEPFFYHFFQQLSAFFLFGDGALPGVKGIRFYSVVKPIPPFFPPPHDAGATPAAPEPASVEPLYERSVDDR